MIRWVNELQHIIIKVYKTLTVNIYPRSIIQKLINYLICVKLPKLFLILKKLYYKFLYDF